MQQFTVPQFIDVEDKIIGPITTRQFIIIFASCLIMAILYRLFDFAAFITFSLIVFVCMVVLAFVKVNGRPFHYFLLNVIQTFKRPSLRVWLKVDNMESSIEAEDPNLKIEEPVPVKEYALGASRLDEMSLIVDTNGAYRGEGR
ncbi:PrgI family protein [Candidatus Falkowbacteria bacterium]|nr:PrgI family protein [Candidatus Falkowbacteria bacterium]